MKTDFIPVNESLKTGMLIIDNKGKKAIVLMDGHNGELGRASGETWFPIYKNTNLFDNPNYIVEVWSRSEINSHALRLSTDHRQLLWKAEPPIMIHGNAVIFQKDGIKIGYTTISHDTVKQIYERIFKP